MRKITLLFALSLFMTSISFAQSNKDCKKTCTVERVVYKDAFLGVKMYGKCESRQAKGAIIKEVINGSVASTTMLQESDVITYLNDVRINNNVEMAKEIKKLQPNELVNIAFRRGEKNYSIDVKLGAKHKEIVMEEVCCDDPFTVEVFPNPVRTNLSLAVNNPNNAILSYQLSNMKGVVVKTQQFEKSSNTFIEEQISTNDLPDGIYILKVTGNNTSVTKKIVVRH